jgi:photosystem II stability/assembly factor-like uncharacterized protein
MRIRAILALSVVVAALGVPGGAQASAAPLNQWHLVNPWLGIGRLTVLAMPGHPNSLYTLTYGRFTHSTDGGATSAITSSPPCGESTMAVDPSDPSRVYVGCMYSGGMLRSTDGGATWAADNAGLMYPGSSILPTISAIAVDPSDGSVYATTQLDELGADVFVSHDGGDSWSPIHDGTWANGIAVSGGRVYAYDGGTITSDDDGVTWSSPASADGSGSLVADPDSPGTVYALAWPSGSTGQAWVTTDGGGQWTQLSSAPADITSASVAGGDVYLGTHSGVYRSTDQGQTWTQSETATNTGQLLIDAVAADPAVPGHVWAMDEYTGVWEVTFGQDMVPGLVPYYIAGSLPATDLTPNSAVLHGVIAATGAGVTGQYAFAWGPTQFYDHLTAWTPLPSSSQAGTESGVSTTLTGLEPDTTYHVQLVALSSWVSTTRPDDIIFTTPPAQSPTTGVDVGVALRHASVPDGQLPVELRWTARAGTYPLCAATLQLSSDGGSFRAIAYPAARAREYDTSLEPGHTYTVRVRTQDCHGLRSAWGSGSFTLRRPAAAPRAVFGPRWRDAAGVHTATARGARATVTFTGREVGIVALRGRGYGEAAVYLDGERLATLNLHARHPAQRRLVFKTAVASPGRHTLVVRVLDDPAHPAVAIESFAVVR